MFDEDKQSRCVTSGDDCCDSFYDRGLMLGSCIICGGDGASLLSKGKDNNKDSGNAVTHPNHYCINGLECIDVIKRWKFDYLEGAILKYLCRYKYKKNPVEDVQKLLEYGRHLLERTKKEADDSRAN